ncbi:MAG: peroxidase-related enzyme [Bacteroidetes bacterium]|jgi:uncharacterized peroxidase-related enzyme|nr:peroxidase-related enzyme [Bacteroidota bacterium]
MGFLSYLGPRAHMPDVILRTRSRYKHMDAFTQHVLRGPSELSPKEREIMATFVSALNACQYCTGVHREVSLLFGMDEGLVQALLDNIDTAPVADKLKPVLHYVKKVTLTPSKAVQADVDAILKAGWSEQTVEDTVAVAALFNYYNRLMDGLGIKGEMDLYQKGAGFLHKRGYVFPAIVAWYFRKFGFK